MKFDGRGFTARPDSGGWEWGLEMQRYGFVGQERRHSRPAVVSAQGQRLSHFWDGRLEEWFVNDQHGLEHGFTVKERPTLDCGSLLPLSGERPAARQTRESAPATENHPRQQALDCGSLLPLSGERPAARQDEPCKENHPGQQAAFTPKRQRAAAVQGYLTFTLGLRGGLRPAISSDEGFVREKKLLGGLKQVEVRDTVPSSAAARRFLPIVVQE